MNTLKISFLFAPLALITVMAVPTASAATIPAGTNVVVKTTGNIYSRDPAGRRFEALLAHNITVGGKVVVPAGTHVIGVVKSPKFNIGSTSRPLTLRLKEIVIHGHAVPIKTDDLEAQSNSPWATRRGVQVTAGGFIYTRGTILPFRLNHAVEI